MADAPSQLEREHYETLRSTVEDYRLPVIVIATGGLLTLLAFFLSLLQASVVTNRDIAQSLGRVQREINAAAIEVHDMAEQMTAVFNTGRITRSEFDTVTAQAAANPDVIAVAFVPAGETVRDAYLNERQLAVISPHHIDFIDQLWERGSSSAAAVGDLFGHDEDRFIYAGVARTATETTPGEIIVLMRFVDLEHERLPETAPGGNLLVFDTRNEALVFSSVNAARVPATLTEAPMAGEANDAIVSVSVDDVIRHSAFVRRWRLPTPFERFELVLAVTPELTLSRYGLLPWLTLLAGFLVTSLLGYIGFQEARKTRTIRAEVDEKTAALQRSNEELERFAYVASHDLRSPLRAISSLVTFIVEDSDTSLSAQSRDDLIELQHRIASMSRLLNGLLEYARLHQGNAELVVFDTAEVAREVVNLLDVPPGFTIDIARNMPRIWGAKPPFELVLRNLVSNALKYHDRDEGRIWISGRIRDEDTAEFRVADDGPGIPPRYRERVFNLFETLTPKSETDGVGLGLAMVKKSVQDNGGRVLIADTAGRGATFVFTWNRISRQRAGGT